MSTVKALSNDAAAAKHYRWQEIPAEPMKGTITRKLISSERMMIAHVFLKKGDDVPQHSHENEQITYILEGVLHFWLGDQGRARIDRACRRGVGDSLVPAAPRAGPRRHARCRCIQPSAPGLARWQRCVPPSLRH